MGVDDGRQVDVLAVDCFFEDGRDPIRVSTGPAYLSENGHTREDSQDR